MWLHQMPMHLQFEYKYYAGTYTFNHLEMSSKVKSKVTI